MLDQLPEDILAMAMSRLCVVDVLACRLVCKRLAGLAQHPDVWRHRHLDVDDYSKSARIECCRVLRLAPCLREISTSVTTALSCRHADLRTTSCAARVLSIAVDMGGKCGPEEATKAVQVIKQQEALGRLRAVSLVFWQTLLEKT
ncbi:uncharacterized protein LOC113213875 [Frankliniella occidentalis]|uniref:Uncharacterized protein LOC113213875 n=1 Tax=Frankliniella occidentalis TaxID=133901 RepID=A0A9C6XDK5_FRAOC|nr:uncharacterized protein LOC113213875 [Frankliniella occidentalis]